MVAAMKNFALVLAALPLALACETTEVSCGMLIRDEALGACVCPPGVEVDYERWLCLFPDAAVPIDPFDAGLDAGSDAGVTNDGGLDSGVDGGVDAGSDTGPSCTPTDEVCEGSVDEDCDGEVDESCDCINDEERACGPDQGVCEAGLQVCAAGIWGECVGEDVPGTEACEGSLDEDCDGSVDEGCACANGTTRPCPGNVDTGDCVAGTQTCVSGAWASCVGAVGPTAEVCDGRDNDCDTVIDGADANASCGLASNATLACTAGACGIQSCATGFRNCDGAIANGCETDIRTNRSHCGSCGSPCGFDRVCEASTCVFAPAVSHVYQDSSAYGFNEVGPDRDPDHIPRIAADDAQNVLLMDPGVDLAAGSSIIHSLSSSLVARWAVDDDVSTTRRPVCGASECSVVASAGSDRLQRRTYSRPIPLVSSAGVIPGTATFGSPMILSSGTYVIPATTFSEAPAAPDVGLAAQLDGRIAVAGRSDVVYLSDGTRVRAYTTDGLPLWVWQAGSGATLVDIEPSAGVEVDATGRERLVFIAFTRGTGASTSSHIASLNAASGLESDRITLASGSVIASLAFAQEESLYVVGHWQSGSNSAGFVELRDSSLGEVYRRVFQPERPGSQLRFTDVAALTGSEAAVAGLYFGDGSLSLGRVSVTDSEQGQVFVVRMRFQ